VEKLTVIRWANVGLSDIRVCSRYISNDHHRKHRVRQKRSAFYTFFWTVFSVQAKLLAMMNTPRMQTAANVLRHGGRIG
jgi:hypothetical protein